MEKELWDEIQYFALGRDDPELLIPNSDYEEVQTSNRLSLIARPLNPVDQNLFEVADNLPTLWGLSSSVHGRVLDDRFIQFRFQSERDLVSVLRSQPWSFNRWFVALQRWDDLPRLDFLTSIDLWVQIRGVPLRYISAKTFRRIARSLGDLVELDFEDSVTNQVSFIRAKIKVSITDRFRFFRRSRFQSGDRAMLGFQYEKMEKICTNCCRIMHPSSRCPFEPVNPNPFNNPRNQDQQRRNEEFEEMDPAHMSQPSSPVAQVPVLKEVMQENQISQPKKKSSPYFALAFPHFELSGKEESTGSNSDGGYNPKFQSKFEVGECSKRRLDFNPKNELPMKKRSNLPDRERKGTREPPNPI
ncbi:PREDICTED: uncharacterized protein At4g02000-like [Camelina sativa]|uniref:Uncharacterized protein At4g02000-like n=1 Tax=Camelina sativa TaxID=90675 RepID=A0ABM0V1R0_CAMSA|nr:PREDICTED: uncharacterized protein At4g02000-like [Camelina sativa]